MSVFSPLNVPVCHNCHSLSPPDKLRGHTFLQSRAENPFPAPWCSFSLLCSLSVLQSASAGPEGLCRGRSRWCRG